MAAGYRCSQCGSGDLVAVTPYWSRCNACQAVTYTPPAGRTAVRVDRSREAGARQLYGAETVPLPVRTDPRKRKFEGILGMTAAALFAISVPLAIVLLAAERGHGIDEVFLTPGVSLVVTLWIFSGIGLAAVAAYSAFQFIWRKSESGGAWIALGILALIVCVTFTSLVGLTGAWAATTAGVLILVAGLVDLIKPGPQGQSFLERILALVPGMRRPRPSPPAPDGPAVPADVEESGDMMEGKS